MKRKLAGVTALLVLLCGCGAGVWEYPRAEAAEPVAAAPVTLGITIPAGGDEALEAAVLTLQAKLLELSGGNVTLESYRSGNVADAMLQEDETGLYLLSAQEVTTLDPDLGFIQTPYLFESADQLLTLLNSPDGVVRGSTLTRERLGGEIVGVYYGGTAWFLGRTRLYDEVGFYSTVGVSAGMLGNDCFGVLGAETVTEGSSEELFALFAQGKIKYCELSPTDEVPDEVLEKAKSLELTNHRYDTRWLLLRDSENQLEPAVRAMVQEAFSYTLPQHDTLRREIETEKQARLEERGELAVPEGEGYSRTKQLARKYYRENWMSLEFPQRVWEEISRLR